MRIGLLGFHVQISHELVMLCIQDLMIRNVSHFIYDDIFPSQFMIYISSGPHADARVSCDSLFLRPVSPLSFVRQKYLVFLLLLSVVIVQSTESTLRP